MAMATTATKALRGGAAAARKILAAGSPRLHPSASSPPTTPQVNLCSPRLIFATAHRLVYFLVLRRAMQVLAELC
jgi:hypothetical protein